MHCGIWGLGWELGVWSWNGDGMGWDGMGWDGAERLLPAFSGRAVSVMITVIGAGRVMEHTWDWVVVSRFRFRFCFCEIFFFFFFKKKKWDVRCLAFRVKR
jgi:hypothetical protein